jgi:hypothetical protein
MAIYTVNNLVGGGTQQAIASTYKTQINLSAATATLTVFAINDIEFGTAGTPADNYMEYDVSRTTAIGTGTAATPLPVNPLSRASGTVATVCHTAEPTVTANSSLLYIPCNQRASYRWVAVPGSELVGAATNLYGIAIRASSAAYTGKVGATVYWTE